MPVKVLFYQWDWKEQPDMADIQRAIDAVFDGAHAPRITEEFPSASDSSDFTYAIVSEPVASETLEKLFAVWDKSKDPYWWDDRQKPTPLEA